MRAVRIGLIAQEACLASWPASVIGVTSGGVFVITQPQRVLFLTYSPFCSPSTINLEPGLTDLRQNANGASVLLAGGRILLPDSGLDIDLASAELWAPPRPTPLTAQQLNGVRGRLERAALLAAEQKGPQGLAPALKWLLGRGEPEMAGDLTEKIVAGLDDLRIAMRSSGVEGALDAVSRIVGHGRGLTPAADDCIAGVLLVLNRWGRPEDHPMDLDRFVAGVLQIARNKTTSLSCTIIEAAAMGQGDERILTVLDGVMTGDFAETLAIQNLVRMGHSSGVDSLVGITLVLTA